MIIARYSHYAAIILIAIFVVISASSVWQKSTTWDEPFHLTIGVTQLQTGDPRLNSDHPPLARLIAAIPTLFMSLDSVVDNMGVAWEQADLINAPNAFFGTIEDRALWPARLIMLSFSVLLGALLYFWGLELFGPVRALLPLTLLVFCPPILANAPIVATDMPATSLMFASIYSWWRYLQAPNLKRLAWVCLSVGAAFTAKFTAILLVPLFIVLGASTLALPAVLSGTGKFRLKIIVGGLLIIAFSTVLAIDLAYGFNGIFLTPTEYVLKAKELFSPLQIGANQLTQVWPMSLPVPLPFTYVSGFFSVFSNLSNDSLLTYFLGQAGYGERYNYFLMLLLVKLPITTLLLIGLGFVRVLDRLPGDGWHQLFFILPPLLIIGIASHGKMQLGIRHILPAFPFLFLLAGYAVEGAYRFWQTFIVSILLTLTVISSLAIHPYYLMYFNFLAGGPEQGWRIATEGNDWAQGGSELRKWLQDRKITSVAFIHHGWNAAILNRAGITVTQPPCNDTGELVVAQIRQLLAPVTVDEVNCYAWMRLREPDEKIGYSIFLYNSKNVRPSPPLNLTLFSEALRLQLAGQLAEAVSKYQLYLKEEPDYYQAHFNLAMALKDLHQCESAIPKFNKTLELWSGYKEAHLHLANCYRELGDIKQAEAHERLYR